jgi:hypothetical protein
VEQARFPARLQLAAPVEDVDLDHVGVGGEVVAPHPGQQLLAPQDLAWPVHEGQQQLELAPGEVDAPATPRHLQRQPVHDQVAQAQHLVAMPAPAQHGPDPGQQLLEGERPAQAVVGPGLQPLDPLADPGGGGEQDDRGLVAGVAQPPADLEPFQPGRAGVEQDAVDRGLAQQVDGALAVAGDGDPEALALEDRTDAVVIVDDQERTPHARLADAGR